MSDDSPRPYTLIAELTYRCPLSCAYCSNPLELRRVGGAGLSPAPPVAGGSGDPSRVPDGSHDAELTTDDWARVFAEAAALGVLQVNLTGGEPLVRGDLEPLVAAARKSDLYINLITSGIPADPERLARLAAAGLDSLQLSVQDSDPHGAAWIAGRDDMTAKMKTAAATRALGLPLTLNVVLHRGNIARVGEFVALAEKIGAARLELANTQYLGWALANREALLPSRAAVDEARAIALAARDRLRGTMEILFVRPDYYADRPRACMDGWARRYIVVTPDGLALPCHQALEIAALSSSWENVRARSLADLWADGAGFRAFRGEAWMPEPCRTCDERTIDFGGCRCQAFALLGDAAATDPACALAPRHDLVVEARAHASGGPTESPLRLRRLRQVQ